MRTRPLYLCFVATVLVVLAGCASAPGADAGGAAPTPRVTMPLPDGLGDPQEPGMRTIAHDDHPDTVLDLHVPDDVRSGTTVVLVHGGFWREEYRRDLMTPLVPSLLAQGHVVVNLEYRRVGGAGGWPTTLTDVAAGIDALADLEVVDADRVVTVGHSAGGHLAVWAAARHLLPVGAPGAGPLVRPCAAVAQAGVLDLAGAAGLGAGAVDALLDGTSDERLDVADPSRLLPTGVPVVLVHGADDDIVPLAQSEAYLAAATAAGDAPRLLVGPGDHFSVIDPAHDRWSDVLGILSDLC